MVLRLLLALACSLAAASAPAAVAAAPPRDAPDPAIADGSAQRGLDDARARWREDGYRSYRFELEVTCFCDPSDNDESYVVRDGRPRDARDQLSTIPRLFRVIQRAIDDEAHELRVTYGRRGIPRRFFVDRSPDIADEELAFRVRGFARLKR